MPTLYDSLDHNGLETSNRIVLAPMTRARSGPDRIPNRIIAEYYAQRSGAGLLLSEATVVSRQGRGWVESPGIYTEEQAEGWKAVTDAVHQKGAPIFLQLWHCGRASHSSFQDDGSLPVSASAIKHGGDYIHTPNGKQPYETPRALEKEEIPGVADDYRQAAKRAMDAGFDGVEIHAANGYLIDQFLQSKTNQRTDSYGGSIENRSRFLLEVLEAVAEVVPANKIGIRLSPNGNFNDMGSPEYREQLIHILKQLDPYGLGYVHVMDGLAFGFHELGDPVTLNDVRKHFSGTVIANCGYDKDSAEKGVAEGKADLVAIGRPYISNPDLAERWQNDWPLNPDADVSDWYSPNGAKGYTDFPFYTEK